jgi:hypothetical protein
MSFELRVKSQKSKIEDKRIRRWEDKKFQLPNFPTSQLLILCLLVTCYLSLVTAVQAEVLERIVAIVNNNVILLSEYEEALEAARKSDQRVTEDAVLDEMINRILILEQAKRLSLGSTSDSTENVDDNKLIKEYIDRRIKAFIHIPIDEIESDYKNNRGRFAEREFYEVKDEIEDYLVERALKRKIAEHFEELRRKAYIRIQKDPAEAR